MSDALLITVAPTGAETAKADCPQLPTTPEEIARTAAECEAAGAAMIHIHVRDGEHAPTLDQSLLREEKSASDVGAPVLVVSQFTLYGDARKGRRPTWQAAAPGPVSEPLYEAVCTELERLGADVARGRFGADMRVESVNDGPITLVLDSP